MVSYSSVLTDIVAGVGAALLQLLFCMIYAVGVFSGPRNVNLFGSGMMMTAIALVVTQLCYAYMSDIPYMFITPDSFYIPLFAGISKQLSESIIDDAEYEHTYMFAVVFAVFIVGLAKWLSAKFGLLKLCDFVPYPVVCGLTAGVGIKILQLSITLSTNNQLKHAGNLLPAIMIAGLHLLGQYYQWNAAAIFSILVASSGVIFYALVYCNGIFVEVLEETNWIFGRSSVADEPWMFLTSEAPFLSSKVNFGAIWGCSGQFVAIAVLMVLSISLSVPIYDAALKRRFNKSEEMRKYGIATMIASIFGAGGTCQSLTALTVVMQMNGSEFLPVVVSSIFFAICYLTKFSFVPYAPKFIFSGLLLSSGYQWTKHSAVDTFWHIPFSEYLIVLAISFFSVYSDMLTAIAVGCNASVVLFAFKFHEIGCVQYTSDLTTFRSSRERSHHHRDYLAKHGRRVRMIQLQGYLAFTNTAQLFDLVNHIFDTADKPESSSGSVVDADLRLAVPPLQGYQSLSQSSTTTPNASTPYDPSPQPPTPKHAIYTTGAIEAALAVASKIKNILHSISSVKLGLGHATAAATPSAATPMTRLTIIVDTPPLQYDSIELLPPLEPTSVDATSPVSSVLSTLYSTPGGVPQRRGAGSVTGTDEGRSVYSDVRFASVDDDNQDISDAEEQLLQMDLPIEFSDAPNERPAAILLHCNQLLGMDASAIDNIEQIVSKCAENNCQLIFVGLQKSSRRILLKAEVFKMPNVQDFCTLDTALEETEDELIKDFHLATPPDQGYTAGFRHCMQVASSRLHVNADIVAEKLENKTSVLSFKAGDRIAAPPVANPLPFSSKEPRGLYFLETGFIQCGNSAKAATAGAQSRPATECLQQQVDDFEAMQLQHVTLRDQHPVQHGPGWIFGHISAEVSGHDFGHHSDPRERDVLLEGRHYYADTDVTVHFLSVEAIEEARDSAPECVTVLYQLLAALLQEQLLTRKEQMRRLLDAMYFHFERETTE